MVFKRHFLLIALPIWAIVACSQSHSQKTKKEQHATHSTVTSSDTENSSTSLGTISDFSYLPTTKRGKIYKKTNYAHSYSSTDFQSEWVAYYLTKAETEGGEERSNNFQTDPTIPNSPDKLDYNQTGYDRGHQAPAADMKFSSQAMEECFYMTNMSPQEPSFNRGIWKDLEEDVRAWAQAKGALYVVTGALFEQDKRMRKTKITVPSHFYKILFNANGAHPTMIAFLLPNAEGSRPMSKYAISVDDLETRSGIDFFAQLPDNIEESLEKNVDLSNWESGSTDGSSHNSSSTSSSASNTEHSSNSTVSLSENLVYVCSTSKGMKYHKQNCGGLSHCKGVTIPYTLEKARKLGFSPCGTCY